MALTIVLQGTTYQFKPLAISVGSPLVQHKNLSLVLGYQRIHSKFPHSLFPLDIEMVEADTDLRLLLHWTAVKSFHPIREVKHQLGTLGYIYPECDISGTLNFQGTTLQVTGKGSHIHCWHHGAEREHYPHDPIQKSLFILKWNAQHLRLTIPSQTERFHVSLDSGEEILVVCKYRNIPQTKFIFNAEGISGPSQDLIFDHGTLKSEKHGCNLVFHENHHSERNWATDANYIQQVRFGTIKGIWHQNEVVGNACWTQMPVFDTQEEETFLRQVYNTETPLVSRNVEADHVAAAVFLWLVPGILFLVVIVMLGLLIHKTAIFKTTK